MPRPVCVNCKREMVLGPVGTLVQFDAIATSGPYQQWHGDTAECPGCGGKIVFRYAGAPSWEHFRKKQAGPDKPDVVVQERPNVLAPNAKVCPTCGADALGTDPIDLLGLCENNHMWSLVTRKIVEQGREPSRR